MGTGAGGGPGEPRGVVVGGGRGCPQGQTRLPRLRAGDPRKENLGMWVPDTPTASEPKLGAHCRCEVRGVLGCRGTEGPGRRRAPVCLRSRPLSCPQPAVRSAPTSSTPRRGLAALCPSACGRSSASTGHGGLQPAHTSGSACQRAAAITPRGPRLSCGQWWRPCPVTGTLVRRRVTCWLH